MRYAAYGSNLHPVRLEARVPSARFLHSTALHGFALSFDKRGTDGSAKANLRVAPGAQAFVAVFELDPDERPILDAVEGPGYRAGSVPLADGRVAYTYFALDAGPGPAPFAWYRDLVLEGARCYAFPRWYVERIASVSVLPDPDAKRRAANERLVAQMRANAQAFAALSGL